jgi:tetratricopeptide (TPR) repeat protein
LSQPDLLNDPLTSHLARAAAAPASREDAIGALTRTGLVTRLDDDRISIHRLVAQVTRHHLATADPTTARSPAAGQWANHAVKIIAGLFPGNSWEPSTWPICSQLVAHVVAVVDYSADVTSPTASAGSVLRVLAIYLNYRAEYTQAKATVERALTIMQAVLGGDHPQVASTLRSLGNIQWELGEFAAAGASHTRALAIFEERYGPDHPEVASTLISLGGVELKLGEVATARARHERSLAIFEAAYGPDHYGVAAALAGLGNVQSTSGDFAAARASLQRGLAVLETVYGPDHPEVANALVGLGEIHLKLGELSAARSVHSRALAILDTVYEPDHARVIHLQRLLAAN